MLKSYLKIALRTLRKHPGYAFINIVGLAVGMACCVLILLFVQDEMNFDDFHEKADRAFRVVETRQAPEQEVRYVPLTVGPLAPALEAEALGVANATRLLSSWITGRMAVSRGDTRLYIGDHLFAEPTFFEVFDFSLLQGDPATALAEPQSVVLTESSARRFFGAEDPMGQTLDIEWFDDPVTVTGVVQDPPPNTHLGFSMLFSYVTLRQFEGWRNWMENWDSDGFLTYVVLEEGASQAAVAARATTLLEANREEEAEGTRRPALQALTDIHFGSAHIEDELNQNESSRAYAYLFSAIALFLILIACINYMNLATAQSMGRTREVGLRKVVGAHKRQLVAQFLGESLLLAGAALVLALALVQLVLPAFNAFFSKALRLDFVANAPLLLGLAGLTLLVGVAAGSYPAFFLSRFRPVAVLKGTRDGGPGKAWLRQGLVVTQFALSILMIVATAVVYDQLGYVQEKNLGFEDEQLLVVDINSGGVRRDFQAIKEEFARIPSVERVSVTSRVPGEWKNLQQVEVAPAEAATATHTMYFIGVDADFLETFGVALLEGRNFEEGRPADSAAVLLNEAAARMLGVAARVGERVRVPAVLSGGGRAEANFEAEVVGIVGDFHFKSLHEEIAPLVLGFRHNPIRAIDYFTLRLSGGDPAAALAAAQAVHERFDPEHPFEYNFLTERWSDFYVNEARVGRLFGIAALLAIFIACLGLFGLAAFTAERRTKEIGVRKVLGATVGGLVALLSKDFARLVGVAFVVAAPVAYLLMSRWLDAFAYRVDLGVGTFLLAGGLVLLLALMTVSYQALRAAVADPVESLRYE